MMMVKCFVLQLWHMLIVQWRLCCSAGDHTVTLSLLCELFCNKCVYLSLSLRVKLPDKDFHSWILTEVEAPILRGFFNVLLCKACHHEGACCPSESMTADKGYQYTLCTGPSAASPHSHFCLCQLLKSRKLLQYSADDRWYCHSSAITQTPGLQQRLIYDCAASLSESWAPEFRSQPPRAQKASSATNKTLRSHIRNTLIFSLKTAKQFRSMSRSCRRINVFHAITNSVGRCLDCVGSEDRDSGV